MGSILANDVNEIDDDLEQFDVEHIGQPITPSPDEDLFISREGVRGPQAPAISSSPRLSPQSPYNELFPDEVNGRNSFKAAIQSLSTAGDLVTLHEDSSVIANKSTSRQPHEEPKTLGSFRRAVSKLSISTPGKQEDDFSVPGTVTREKASIVDSAESPRAPRIAQMLPMHPSRRRMSGDANGSSGALPIWKQERVRVLKRDPTSSAIFLLAPVCARCPPH